ncbi:unnamed protein product [Strongylus vulgaris]|uniref:Uncharacterized protein n=1 Tax=Strongylus vulgaris TaxID=40348 RepID=A0A3P7KEW5_STRVU|nr:unnamed protein product [Strongylus vulgaris]
MIKALVVEKGYTCDDHEEELFDNCYIVVEKDGPFTRDACPEGYSLHILESKQEFKYISAIYDNSYQKLYIGNTGDNAKWLNVQTPKPLRRRARDDSGGDKPIYVRIKSGPNRDGTVRGGAYWGPAKKNLPYLCSRPAIPYEETSQDFDEHLKQLGFDTIMVKNKFGQKRTFVDLGAVFAVEGDQFKADFTKLHDPCSVSFFNHGLHFL